MDKGKFLEKYKYPLLVLAFGLLLMLMPGGQGTEAEPAVGEEALSQLLSHTEGAGQTQVLVSEQGVVVLSQGAERADIRLKILQAVQSYTGFAADKITVLKMAN